MIHNKNTYSLAGPFARLCPEWEMNQLAWGIYDQLEEKFWLYKVAFLLEDFT